jgi:hypothetical protein
MNRVLAGLLACSVTAFPKISGIFGDPLMSLQQRELLRILTGFPINSLTETNTWQMYKNNHPQLKRIANIPLKAGYL